MLTGQLIFRDAGIPSHRKGHKLMMVCGIVAVPDDIPIKGEHQYVITGCKADLGGGGAEIHIHFDTEVDLTKQLAGLCLNNMIKSPLWRV